MINVTRYEGNPILAANAGNAWEAEGVFNGCPVRDGDTTYLLYRAQSAPAPHLGGPVMSLSSIGIAKSSDGVSFTDRRRLIVPEYDWEKFGCEDPRVTKLGDTYYIFYTGLSDFPFTPPGIHVGLAKTRSLDKVTEKHRITPFNAKAMALFPEKIRGKFAAILTVNTDMPPPTIALALVENEADLWSDAFWEGWYANLGRHALPLLRSRADHIEVGAPPLKTHAGWVIFYSYIRNYQSRYKLFGTEAVLLDYNDPHKILGSITTPLLIPEKEYELSGKVPNVAFPSGVLRHNDSVCLYYGAADTTCAVAGMPYSQLMTEITAHVPPAPIVDSGTKVKLERFDKNPIIKPNPRHPWESKAAFNPGAIALAGSVHILYRAMGDDDTSVVGYARSSDGVHIDEHPDQPVYVPRESFEKKSRSGNSGCEDVRLTQIGDRVYMCYTAYDAKNPTRVALTSIAVSDFLKKQWTWEKPVIISPPGVDDKNTCLLPKTIDGRYVFFHRIDPCIWVDFVDSLSFPKGRWIKGGIFLTPRTDRWDSEKVGVAGPPVETSKGWLLIYHGLSREDRKYRLGALLLDRDHPDHILARLDHPILEPEAPYEMKGVREGTVFSCGVVLLGDRLFVYYGGADTVTCVAWIPLNTLLSAFA